MRDFSVRSAVFAGLAALVMVVAGCGDTSGGGGVADVGTDALMCGDTTSPCSGQCVDKQSSDQHCGACGNVCTGGTYCELGSCTCINPDHKKCDGACVNQQTNNNHCGKCNNSCPAGSKCESGSCEQLSVIEKVIQETNEVRSTETDCGVNGMKPSAPPVEGNPHLHEAAQMHSDRMAEFDFFAHDDPENGTNFADRIGMTDYTGSPVGENIAVGQRNAEAVVEGWRKSDGHCANMMRQRATEMGVGYTTQERGRSPYWVQVFGNDE